FARAAAQAHRVAAVERPSLLLREVLCRVADGLGNLGLNLRPALRVPDLEVVVHADHDAGPLEAGVLDEVLGEPHAPSGIELLVEGVAVKVAAERAAPGAQRARA